MEGNQLITPTFGDFLANLAAELGALIVEAWGRRVGEQIHGTPREQALRHCLDAGLVAFLRRAQAAAPVYVELLQTTDTFFHRPDVVKELSRLLRGQRLDVDELHYLFTSAGYPAQDRFDFAAAMADFEIIFLLQATEEESLRETIQAAQLLQQTRLLTEQAGLLREILGVLRQIALRDIVGIAADTITATNVVSGTQVIYELKPEKPSPDYPDHWESHYLKALITRCGGLDLTTLSASEATADTLAIDAVFTTLYLENVSRSEDETVADVLRPAASRQKGRDADKREMAQSEKERLPITATEAVAGVRRLVILGQPGGGKSTLVNHITTQLARQRRGDAGVNLRHWPAAHAPLPVRIVLRRFADWLTREKRRGETGDVWDYLAYLLGRWGCSDSYNGLRQTLIKEGGVFFFDGLDEIRDVAMRRAVIKGAVARFAADEDKCQVIVTSRPYAYDDTKWRLPDDQFAVVRLAPFDDPQIEAFITAWYTQVMGPRRDWSQEQFHLRASRLTRTILGRPHLRRLAASPLLLTLMAQVDSNGVEAMLPNNRAELYKQTVDLLLARWENRLQLDDNPGAEVPDEKILWLDGLPTLKLRDVLARLAYEGHRDQRQTGSEAAADGPAVEITYQQLKDALLPQFDSLKRVEEIITYIQHRTGLLVDKGEGVFTFPHRTYQEYLAGQHLQNIAGWQPKLIKHVRDAPDWWREVFLLSAASMPVADSIQFLVQALLPSEETITRRNAPWLMIAAQALVETNFHYYVELEKQQAEQSGNGPLDSDSFAAFYRRVQTRLKIALVAEDVLPPKLRGEAGQWLAQLGDDRPGVGIIEQNGIKLPDIIWSAEIPAGTYTIGDDKSRHSSEKSRQVPIQRTYRLARYPVTNAQFQCFVDAVDRDNPKWWAGIPGDERKFSEPQFPYASHPRERASWYQAVAFCRWLTQKLHDGLLPAETLTGDPKQYTITLPHEFEWEVAARWPNEGVQERIYPWGPEFDAAKANTREGDRVGQTTAVGLYPSGKNAALDLYDMSGNIWEWCRNKYGNPDEDVVDDSGTSRVVRGGSWGDYQGLARAAYRSYFGPGNRSVDAGFRVVVVRFSPSHQGR